jgi:hypothetical protein
MSVSNAGKVISSRQKLGKSKGETTVEVENNQGQNINPDKEEPNATQSVQATNGTLTVADVLPLSSNNLQIAQTASIAGLRPIGTSSLQVIETYNVMGIRPISANTFQVVNTLNLSGIRPIASSSLVVVESYSIFGNRPIASNTVDDSESLMGFID